MQRKARVGTLWLQRAEGRLLGGWEVLDVKIAGAA
jgi:hypothetical protein